MNISYRAFLRWAERWLVDLVMAAASLVLERFVARSIRRLTKA
ncbi:MAG TPA: hypothetical protein VFR86_11655 [Burkholderiaceae bacterium]|nr:hypothetical protein [Burkholderiaceae bacterium]